MAETKLKRKLSIIDNDLKVVVTARHVPSGLELSSDPMLSDKDAKAQVEAKLAAALEQTQTHTTPTHHR